jgi:hypothetical protein
MVKKKTKAETTAETPTEEPDHKVKIYKVCIPSFLAYPSWKASLEIYYTREEAEKYIQNYPNIMIASFLSIVEEEIRCYGTD